MTAGIDLTLALVEDDLGPEMAKGIARNLVVYHRRRAANRSSPPCWSFSRVPTGPEGPGVCQGPPEERTLRGGAGGNRPSEPAPVQPYLPRGNGQSPAKAVENLRLDAARTMLEDGRHSLDTVAQETASLTGRGCGAPSCGHSVSRPKSSSGTLAIMRHLRSREGGSWGRRPPSPAEFEMVSAAPRAWLPS